MTPIGQCRCVGGGVGCWRAVGGGAGGRGCARAVRARGVDLGVPTGLGGSGGGRVRPGRAASAAAAGAAGGVLRAGLGAVLAGAVAGGAGASDRRAARAGSVELSRDGKRVYVTNSIYAAWDDIFYPDGVGAWMAKLDADPERGGIAPDVRFFPNAEDFRG